MSLYVPSTPAEAPTRVSGLVGQPDDVLVRRLSPNLVRVLRESRPSAWLLFDIVAAGRGPTPLYSHRSHGGACAWIELRQGQDSVVTWGPDHARGNRTEFSSPAQALMVLAERLLV